MRQVAHLLMTETMSMVVYSLCLGNFVLHLGGVLQTSWSTQNNEVKLRLCLIL